MLHALRHSGSTPGIRMKRNRLDWAIADAEKHLIHVEVQKQGAEWIDPELAATRFADFARPWLNI